MNSLSRLNFCCALLTISTTLASGCGKEPQLATAQEAPSTQPQPGASAKPPAPSFSLPVEAVEYAAKNFPRALHVPKIVLSDKLKQQSFAAAIRYPEKLKQVLSLSEQKNWTGMVRLILSYEKGDKFLIRDEYPSTVADKIAQVESALNHLRGKYWKFPVAIQSPKASFDGQNFTVAEGKKEKHSIFRGSCKTSELECPGEHGLVGKP